MGNEFLDVKKKIQFYCSYQERSHKEVVVKLKLMNVSKERIEIIVANLIKNDFLNETRFAISFARGKFRIKKWGKVKIMNKLKSNNISSWNITEAIKELDDDEYLETFNLLFIKFWNKYKNDEINYCKKKVYDLLHYRGWESQLIYESINKKIYSL